MSEHSALHSSDHSSYIRLIVVNNLFSFTDKMHFVRVSATFAAIAILASLWRSELMRSERIWKSTLLWRWRILFLVSFMLLWYAEWWEMIERKIENRDFALREHLLSLSFSSRKINDRRAHHTDLQPKSEIIISSFDLDTIMSLRSVDD